MTDIGKRRDNVHADANNSACRRSYTSRGTSFVTTEFGGAIEVNLSQRELGFALVYAGNPGAQQGDLVVDVLHGVLQRPAPAHGLRFDRRARWTCATCRSAVAVSTAAFLIATAI